MNAIRSIQTVSGPTLTIPLPEGFSAELVEIIIRPVETAEWPQPSESDLDGSPEDTSEASLTDSEKAEREQKLFSLRGMGTESIDPYEPAASPEDWAVYRKDRP